MASAGVNPTKRLLHELAALQKERKDDEVVEKLRPWDVDAEDLTEWYARLRAPSDGVYAGGHFDLSIRVPANYPLRPPTIRFCTRVFHPNVHWKVRARERISDPQSGEICLDVLQSQWSPAWTIYSACMAIIALLDVPEPDSPLNVDAANLLRTGDKVAYRALCQMYVAEYASGEV